MLKMMNDYFFWLYSFQRLKPVYYDNADYKVSNIFPIEFHQDDTVEYKIF